MTARTCMVSQFEELAELDDEEKALLGKLESSVQSYAAGEILQTEGEENAPFFSLHEGWACSIRLLPGGERQVLEVFLPGQIMDLHSIGFSRSQSELLALTAIKACPIPRERLEMIFSKSPRLAQLFFVVLAREHALLTTRIIDIGRRPAAERLGHFIIELKIRTRSREKEFELPLTQSIIGDALGMSSVHVSRTMTQLKDLNLISTHNRRLRIENMKELMHYCRFDPAYLSPGPT
jgi:CRP-like cAMP-binding protein